MPIALIPGADIRQARTVLEEAHLAVVNLPGGPIREAEEFHSAYLEWARGTADRLDGIVTPSAIEELVLTRTYWALLNAPTSRGPIHTTVRSELQHRARALEVAISELAAQNERWSQGFGPFVVLDTSVFIEHERIFPESLPVIEEHVAPIERRSRFSGGTPVQFVIPLKVIDELDQTKAERSRGRASMSLAAINRLMSGDPAKSATVEGTRRGSALHLLLDDRDHDRLPNGDAEIVDRSLHLAAVCGEEPIRVGIACLDTGMDLRARAAGLSSYLLPDRREESTKKSKTRTTPR